MAANVNGKKIASAQLCGGVVTASSEWAADHGVFRSKLHSVNRSGSDSWCASANDDKQWIQISLPHPVSWASLKTQGRGKYDQWVTSYNIFYSLDGMTFQQYGSSFTGQSDSESIVEHSLSSLFGRVIRICPVSWHNHISLRFDAFYEIDDPPAQLLSAQYCGAAITASSEHDANHGVFRSQLTAKNRVGSNSWCASSNDKNQWIQASFATPVSWSSVATKGRGGHNQWVTQYEIYSSQDGRNFSRVGVYKGNVNVDTIVKHTFSPPVFSRVLRIVPIAWNGHISLCFDAFFSPPGCFPLGNTFLLSGSKWRFEDGIISQVKWEEDDVYFSRVDNGALLLRTVLGQGVKLSELNVVALVEVQSVGGEAFLMNENTLLVKVGDRMKQLVRE